jgi:hypothetical protein
VVRFLGDGTIISDDPGFDDEISRVLNLNAAFLKNNRKDTLKAFQVALERRGPLSRTTLEKWLHQWNGESDTAELKPFCQVVVYWLRKRLARSSM